MRWAVLAVALALPLSAQAAGDCSDRDSVIEEIECLDLVLSAEDAELNRVWKRVMADFPSGGEREMHRGEIRAAQRAWIAFRDADCEARSKTGIPKYWALNRLSCLVEETRKRTRTLTEVYLY